ncbi:DUF4179 domain-containing protein [Clostridium aciditolerans]|uniref:DUF4179 domain-containing protein n=1 Tax=Clostridium aciditolerans TaxID=339861 RepID=A0A934M307_9CLOT|nr:DUF4179 domain-containing protein [Clostridium aciditolerans]MBI6872682.1 DUF4179 domain-containing protein [Clostridium aciditolerans]
MDSLEKLKNEIKIPIDIDLAVKKGIKRGRRERKIANFKRTYKKIAVVAAVVLVVTTTVGIVNPDIAKAIPGIKSIFKLINYNGMGESFNKFEQFSTSVNKTVEKDGIKITIDEIVIDNNTLAITSIIEGKKLKENGGDMGNIKLNGKSVTAYASKDKKIDDNKLIRVTYANISDMELPNDIDVDLNIVWIGDVKGPWDFKFKVSKTNKSTNSRTINLDKSIKIPNSTLNLEKLVISPLGNTIIYTGVYDKLNENMKDGIFGFVVIDDKGRKLESDFGGGSSNKENYEGKIKILNDLSNVKALTIVPVLKNWGDKTKEINGFHYSILQTTVNSIDFSIPQEVITKSRPVTAKEKSLGYAFDNVIHVFNIDKAREFSTIEKLVNQVIKVGENSTVRIKDIEATDKETKVTFKFEGNGVYPFRNINQTVIIDKDYNDIERAEDGAIAVLENVEERIVSIKLPPIDKSKKYKIALPIVDEPQVEDKYKINIDLTK